MGHKDARRERRQARPAARSSLRGPAALALFITALGSIFLYTVSRVTGPGRVGDEAASVLVSAQSPTRGPATAGVHIVEFLDPACEQCARMHPLIERVVQANPVRIRLSVRHLSLHEDAEFAVRMLEASREQDRYWEMLDVLLSTQRYWAPDHRSHPELVRRAASLADIDLERLEHALHRPEVDHRIADDRLAARALNVSTTPTYFVNRRIVTGRSEAELLGLISRELDHAY